MSPLKPLDFYIVSVSPHHPSSIFYILIHLALTFKQKRAIFKGLNLTNPFSGSPQELSLNKKLIKIAESQQSYLGVLSLLMKPY